MTRTTIALPQKLKRQAKKYAESKGQSLSDVITEFVESGLRDFETLKAKRRKISRKNDPYFNDNAVWTGSVPPDLSERHDDYLYGEDQ